jgi:kynurenine formamidase
MMESQSRRGPEDFRALLQSFSRWGRWGDDDQVGATNLITPDKIVAAAGLVREGVSVSLAREFPKTPSANNPTPATHYSRVRHRGTEGVGLDYISTENHGRSMTHLDALCHVWDLNGMWNGRRADDVFGADGATWGGIENWSNGVVTRGVMLDVAAYRPAGFVDIDQPVTADELRAISRDGGIRIKPGDALVIHSGRDAWERAHSRPWSAPAPDGDESRPGLDASCLEFLHESDCSVLIWDMLESKPTPYSVRYTVHSAIFNQGILLLDNALLEPLADRCRELGRHDFMITIAPLRIVGGTGSPVNPLALL